MPISVPRTPKDGFALAKGIAICFLVLLILPSLFGRMLEDNPGYTAVVVVLFLIVLVSFLRGDRDGDTRRADPGERRTGERTPLWPG